MFAAKKRTSINIKNYFIQRSTEKKMLEIDKSTVDFLVTENMVKEVEHVINGVFPKIDLILNEMQSRKIDQVLFVACGSPLSACETAQMLFEKYSDIPCRAISGWDFLDNTPYRINKNTLVVGVSHYGKTEEVSESVKLAKDKGAMTVGITRDVSGVLLCEASEFNILYGGECIWAMHLLTTYYLACNYIKSFGENNDVSKILSDIQKLPEILKNLINTVEEDSKKLGLKATEWPFIYTVAAGPLKPLAYKEGVITMMEFTWTHGCVLNSAEFRHGPLEVVEQGIPYVFMLGNDGSRHTTERTIEFVKKYTDNVIVFDVNDFKADMHPMLSPLILFVPLEFFYYYLSIGKDHNPDKRRYYGGLVEY